MIDWLKNVSDPSFVCPSSEQEITKSLKIQFFSIVDCNEKDSKWEYDFKVNKSFGQKWFILIYFDLFYFTKYQSL